MEMAVIFVILLVWGQSDAYVNKTTFQKMVNRTEEMPVDGYIQQISPSRSKIDCGSECLMTSNCTTFYYDSDINTCQIHASLPPPGTLMTYSTNAECYSTEEEPVLWSSPVTYSATSTTTLPTTTPGCVYGTFSYNNGERCYFFDNGLQRAFGDSKSFCTDNNGIIVKVDNQDQHNFIADMLTNNGMPGAYYIGLHDPLEDDIYRWSDPSNTLILYTNWGNTQPSNGGENCVVMYGPDFFKWHNTDCGTNAYVVCEK